MLGGCVPLHSYTQQLTFRADGSAVAARAAGQEERFGDSVDTKQRCTLARPHIIPGAA